jgi:hypothetical protein
MHRPQVILKLSGPVAENRPAGSFQGEALSHTSPAASEHFEHSQRIPFMLEDDDRIIRKADESCTASKSRHYLVYKPLIKHLMRRQRR